MNKIYENDSYCRETATSVTSCACENGRIYLQLADTIFFPEEGGQHADTGLLIPEGSGEAPVHILDGEYRGGDIRYLTDREIPAGTRVRCVLDWEQRFSRMQQHSGEHILTGTIHRKYGYTNVGFHLSDDGPVTLDLSGPLTFDQAMEMEQAANEIIYENLLVNVSYPSREELADLHYRSKIDIQGQVRLIGIGEGSRQIDLCACCAPHVARTGEIGLIKIISLQNYKGGVRIGILCGSRAMDHYRREWQRLSDLARTLSTGVEQIPEVLAGLRQELLDTRQQLAGFREAALMRELEALPAGDHAILFTEGDLPPTAAKNIFNTMAARFPGYVGLFLGDDAQGYRYQAGSLPLDARQLAQRFREDLQARGGGSSDMIQGKTTASRAQIEEFWKKL